MTSASNICYRWDVGGVSLDTSSKSIENQVRVPLLSHGSAMNPSATTVPIEAKKEQEQCTEAEKHITVYCRASAILDPCGFEWTRFVGTGAFLHVSIQAPSAMSEAETPERTSTTTFAPLHLVSVKAETAKIGVITPSSCTATPGAWRLMDALHGRLPGFGTLGRMGFSIVNWSETECALDFRNRMPLRDLERMLASDDAMHSGLRGSESTESIAAIASANYSRQVKLHRYKGDDDGTPYGITWHCTVRRCAIPFRLLHLGGHADVWKFEEVIDGLRCATGLRALLEGNRCLSVDEMKGLAVPCSCAKAPIWSDLSIDFVHGVFNVFCRRCNPARLRLCVACGSILRFDGKSQYNDILDTAVEMRDVFKGHGRQNDSTALLLCLKCCERAGIKAAPPCADCMHGRRGCPRESCARYAARRANLSIIEQCTTVYAAKLPLLFPGAFCRMPDST